MKIRIVSICMASLILFGCNFEREYKYIQIDENKGSFSRKKFIENDKEIIVAKSDSIAYLDAFKKFTISVKVNQDLFEAVGKIHTAPYKFKLLDPNGKDITNSVSFRGKDSLEKDIIESVLSLGNTVSTSVRKSRGEISKDEFGDKWPLTVSSGKVLCLDGSFVLFVGEGGTYAVNGTARSAMKRKGWRDINDIWKADPEYPEAKISIGPVLNRGLELCR